MCFGCFVVAKPPVVLISRGPSRRKDLTPAGFWPQAAVPRMTPQRRDALMATYRDGLVNDVLPFWFGESDEPTPAFAAMLEEEYANRLAMLPKPELRQIAVLRMQGYTNEEIAAQLGCAVRTVARRLDFIRSYFKDGDDTTEAHSPVTPP